MHRCTTQFEPNIGYWYVLFFLGEFYSRRKKRRNLSDWHGNPKISFLKITAALTKDWLLSASKAILVCNGSFCVASPVHFLDDKEQSDLYSNLAARNPWHWIFVEEATINLLKTKISCLWNCSCPTDPGAKSCRPVIKKWNSTAAFLSMPTHDLYCRHKICQQVLLQFFFSLQSCLICARCFLCLIIPWIDSHIAQLTKNIAFVSCKMIWLERKKENHQIEIIILSLPNG